MRRLLLLALLLAGCAPAVGVRTAAHVPDWYDRDVGLFQRHLLEDDWQASGEARRDTLCRRYWTEPDMMYEHINDTAIPHLLRAAFDAFYSDVCGRNPGVVG